MKILRSSAAIVMLFLAGGWGATGHRVINGESVRHLPPDMAAFISQKAWLSDSASVADWRRSGSNGYLAVPSDGPKHYIDVDDYPEHATRSLTTDLSALIAQYGSYRVTQNGTLPWAIGDAVDTLTAALRRRDLRKVWSTASDLGHYVGDGHNPLHCTVDYNGRASLPGSYGLHSRYETSMVNRYSSSLTIEPDSVSYVPDVVAFALGFVYDSQTLVDTLYASDLAARIATGWNGSGSAPAAYLDALWQRTGSITRDRFQKGSVAFSSLLYTAWVDAGRPDLSAVTSVEDRELQPASFRLLDPYPNPFNPSTTVSFVLDRPTSIRLDLIGLDGRLVATLADGAFPSGLNHLVFDASRQRMASGLYLVRLSDAGRDRADVRKLLLLH
ncbi:MAG: hypothetical protein MUE68_08990 [Bacteroidetes bacterium]|jgi:hypothetical protein|nr:hypothetical protein [Bacteroidota bacterium]